MIVFFLSLFSPLLCDSVAVDHDTLLHQCIIDGAIVLEYQAQSTQRIVIDHQVPSIDVDTDFLFSDGFEQ